MEDDKNKKDTKFTIGCAIGAFLIIALICIVLYETSIGVAYFLSEGGWKWLLVVVGCILLALLFGPRNSSPH